jgi:hypothetical protein
MRQSKHPQSSQGRYLVFRLNNLAIAKDTPEVVNVQRSWLSTGCAEHVYFLQP